MEQRTIPSSELDWRRKQKPGTIMKPSTFEKIKENAMKRGLSEERAEKVAGKAYWEAEHSKYILGDKNKRAYIRK